MPIVLVELGGEPVLIRGLNQASQESARLGCLPRNLLLDLGNGHPFTRAHPDRVGLEFGQGGQDVEEYPGHRVIGSSGHRVIGIMDMSTRSQLHPLFLQLVGDTPSIWNRFRQAV